MKKYNTQDFKGKTNAFLENANENIKDMKKNNPQKFIGTVLMLIASVVIVFAVLLAPEKKAVPTEADTTAPAEAASSVTEQTTEEPTTELPTAGEYTVTNYIVVTDNAGMEIYSIAKGKLTSYAEVINTFAAKVPDKQIYCMLAPTRIAFYGPDEYRTGQHSQPDGINIAYSALKGNNIKAIDAYGEISRHTNDYIYFHTDHHWTARGAYYAYNALCKATGQSYAPLESYQSGKLDGFVGSMYRYTNSKVLESHPDYVEYFMPIVDTDGQFFTTPEMSDGKTLRIITTNITDRASKYMCFIQGDKALERIKTSSTSGKKILVIKESYGNALVPFLLENYSEVYVLDPRQSGVSSMSLKKFVDDNGIGEILFINYVMAPSNSKYMNALTNIVNTDPPTAAPATAAPAPAPTEAPAQQG